MKRGKILSLIVATSITAGTFAGVQVPQIAYGQDVSQEESTIDLRGDENYGDVVESKDDSQVGAIVSDSDIDGEEISDIDATNLDTDSNSVTTIDDDVDVDNTSSAIESEEVNEDSVAMNLDKEENSAEDTSAVMPIENSEIDVTASEPNENSEEVNEDATAGNDSSVVATESEDKSDTDTIISDSDIDSENVISIDTTNIASSEDAISIINDTTNPIDTSEFDNQESFQGDYDNIDENQIDAQAIDNSGARVSENYYDFNIAGAQKYTYGTSGKGRPLYYYKVGSGDKVLLLNFGIHGYEDAWARDGEELTKLAKNLIEKLAKDNAAGGLNGWTVVIVPTSNPDGVLDGWTNNGPGRAQVSQKIDLNRSFPTFFTPQYSARYYTGPTALAAPEAKALASLVDQYSSSSKHMALVDVHGWLNQTIGDPSLGKAFNNSFGISNKLMSTSASGYLISYAHSKGALATLLELPMPSSQASITNNGYANKIYSGVKSIINNGDGFEVMNAEGQVTTNSLNIRITTSTNSNIIGTYKNGAKITILGKVGNWYQVKSSAGYGYVSADYVKILSNNTNSGNNNGGNNGGSVEAPTTYQTGKVSNISTSLNIRKSPSTSSGIITSLRNGTELKVVGTEGDWYKVYSESFGYGYASKSYITIVSSNNGNNNNGGGNQDNNQGSSTQTGTIVNISTTLNVRASASTTSKILGTLKNGANISIISKEGSWYKISYNGTIGYVHGDYVKVNDNSTSGPSTPNTPEQTPSTPETTQTGQVINVTTKLNIRSGAGTNFGIVGSVGGNATVNILGQEGSWYKISYNGVTGYVSGSYIKVNSNGSNNTDSTVKYGKVVNISTRLNIRKSASTSSSIVGTLSNNTKVTILEKTNGWYKISYNGTVGYVSASYIAEI